MDGAAARRELVERLRRRGDISDRVLDAIGTVPRHEFVPAERRQEAYEDRPLPIGHGQTISAPHMVALMGDLLDLEPGDRVLEIGTGCGYHTAVTATLVAPTSVFSVEYVPELARAASRRLARLDHPVNVRVGDGARGWPEHAPYDAIYLTCAAPSVPAALVEQLAPGGVLVAPVGEGRSQTLVRLHRDEAGGVERTTHGRVRFVRMQGDG